MPNKAVAAAGVLAFGFASASEHPAAVGASRVSLTKMPSQRDPDDASLDPLDWSALRASAHKLLDASFDRLEAAREGRVWTPCPDGIKDSLCAAPPEEGLPTEELAERLAALLPYGVGNTHPRFFGWVHGAGSPGGILPELVGAAMNAVRRSRLFARALREKPTLEGVRPFSSSHLSPCYFPACARVCARRARVPVSNVGRIVAGAITRPCTWRSRCWHGAAR